MLDCRCVGFALTSAITHLTSHIRDGTVLNFQTYRESCGAYFETTFRFDHVDDGTLVTLHARTETRPLRANLMSPLGNLTFGKMMCKCMSEDLDDLAQVAERRTAG